MALNIDLVNGAINVYEDGETPRTYFGVIGASGKFYPSGTIGAVSTGGALAYTIISNTTADCDDDIYDNQSQASTSGNGSGGLFKIEVGGEAITLIQPATGVDTWAGSGSGYVVKDTITFNGSDYGGTGECVIKVEALGIDGFLIVIGGDDYQVKWSDLVINGDSPTSLQNTQELLSALFSSLSLTPKYKVYSALLTQVNTDPPTAIILENTLGFDPTWEYIDNGVYGFDFPTAPDFDKIATFIQTYNSYITKNSDKDIVVSATEGDDTWNSISVEIRVYN